MWRHQSVQISKLFGLQPVTISICEIEQEMINCYEYYFRDLSFKLHAYIAGDLLWVRYCWHANQGVWGSSPGLYATIPEIGYILFPSRDMAAILLKRRKSLKNLFQSNYCLVYIVIHKFGIETNSYTSTIKYNACNSQIHWHVFTDHVIFESAFYIFYRIS